MHAKQRKIFAINAIGGIAVLGSYAWGICLHPNNSGQVWGGVPEWLKPTYTASMLLAAAGYFPLFYFINFRVDPERVRVGGYGFDLFGRLYVAILLPSALWMPMTFAMLAEPRPWLWLAIRLVLFTVGAASLATLAALLLLQPRQPGWPFRLAVLGCAAFCVQTALLDALVWPAYFPR